MQFILTPNEMRLADRTAIETYKIPGELLMEMRGVLYQILQTK